MVQNMTEENSTQLDNSNKSILARGCDPALSQWATLALPPLIGNPEYVATTDDDDFIAKLQSRDWSVIYFAPGACRFSAAKMQIPGGTSRTRGWTLEEYRTLIQEIQGDSVPIVESVGENEGLVLLKEALKLARETR